MPALPDLQRRFAAVLAGAVGPDALAADIATGRIPLRRQLLVHRNTVCGGLCQALRLRHPAVARLVGIDAFDQAALDYAAGEWPLAPQLGAWGAGFAAFLGGHALAASRPWLPDLARFESLLEELGVLRDDGPEASWRCFSLGPDVELALAPSLRLRVATHAVDELREAALASNAAGPAGDPGDPGDPGDHDHIGDRSGAGVASVAAPLHLAIWRDGADTRSRRIGAVAAVFLENLCAGSSAAAALESAIEMTGATATDALAALQREVFTAPFAVLRRAGTPQADNTGKPPCNG